MEIRNKAHLSEIIVKHLQVKHGDNEIHEESDLSSIGEPCDYSLMFELCRLFEIDDRCSGSEIGKYARVYNAIDAVYELL